MPVLVGPIRTKNPVRVKGAALASNVIPLKWSLRLKNGEVLMLPVKMSDESVFDVVLLVRKIGTASGFQFSPVRTLSSAPPPSHVQGPAIAECAIAANMP